MISIKYVALFGGTLAFGRNMIQYSFNYINSNFLNNNNNNNNIKNNGDVTDTIKKND